MSGQPKSRTLAGSSRRFQMATGQLDNNRRLRTVRHDIARIYTILHERELGLSVAPNEVSA